MALQHQYQRLLVNQSFPVDYEEGLTSVQRSTPLYPIIRRKRSDKVPIHSKTT